jgi:hypothetical protein
MPEELIYTGNCKKIIDDLNKSLHMNKRVIINRKDIKVKKGTQELLFPVQEWRYYPVSFECADNIEGPVGNFLAGDFVQLGIFGSNIGYMIKRT